MQWFDIIIKNKKLKEQIKKFESLNIGYREFWNPVNSHNLYKKIKCFGDNSYEIQNLAFGYHQILICLKVILEQFVMS